MATAYIGNPLIDEVWVWRYQTNRVTKLGTSGGRFDNTGPLDGQVLTLSSDEYPTGISFSGADIANINAGNEMITVSICDEYGNNAHQLISRGIEAGGYFSVSTMNASGDWVDLAGKTISLKKVGQNGTYLTAQAAVEVTVGYLERVIGIIQTTGGTVAASASAAVRGAEVLLTVTPDDQYWYCSGIVASAGVITKISDTQWKLTMPTPAIGVTVTPEFTRSHAILPSGAGISFSQNEYQLTITKHGTCEDTLGLSVAYRLVHDGAYVGLFNGESIVITLTDEDMDKQHRFEIWAFNSTSILFTSGVCRPLSVHKTIGYCADGQFKPAIGYYWNGTQWQEVWPYYWNGSNWVLCSQT